MPHKVVDPMIETGPLVADKSLPKGASLKDNIEIKTNIEIIARARGKIVSRYQGHNVFLNYGRAWVLDLISYAVAGYPTTVIPTVPAALDRRVRYIGFGIGGVGQVASIPVGVDTYYPGTNVQTDTDVTITELERPVAVSIAGPAYMWEKELALGSTTWNIAPYYVRYEASFGVADITLTGAPGPWAYVPLSEIALYENSCDPTDDYATVRYNAPPSRPNPVCYHTFYTISKTSLISLTVRWDLILP